MEAIPPALAVEDVHEALRDVIDPEFGFNIIDLGLVYDVAIEGSRIDVAITMTRPDCPAEEYIATGAERRLAELSGVSDVSVNIVWTPAWSPQRMSEAAKAYFQVREASQ